MIRQIVLGGLLLCGGIAFGQEVIAHWDFSSGKIDSVDGKFQTRFRGSTQIQGPAGKQYLDIGINNNDKPEGIIAFEKYPELTPKNAFRLVVKARLREETSIKKFLFLWDTLYHMTPKNDDRQRGFAFYLVRGKDNRFRPEAWFGFGNYLERVTGNWMKLEENKDFTLALEYDGIKNVSFYLNGRLTGTAAFKQGGKLAKAIYPMVIGDRYGSGYNRFDGQILEVKLVSLPPEIFTGQKISSLDGHMIAFGTPDDFQGPDEIAQEGNVLLAKGSGEYRSAKTLALDAAANYRFSAEFRMKSGTPAKIAAGFIPLDENGTAIHPTAVNPIRGTETEVAESAPKGSRIIKVKDASRWKNNISYGFIALNAKEGFSDLPNRNVMPIVKAGIKQNGGVWEIALKSALRAPVAAGTKVRQHADGSTYIWNVALNQTQDQWIKKIGKLSGQVVQTGIPLKQLWPGTKKVRLVIRINGKPDSVTEIRNVKLEEVRANFKTF